jgi:hypothetical protein
LADLRAIVDRELRDSAIEGLSLDAQLGMLYNAALKLADIALRQAGYRSGRERAHERTIGSLVLTLGEDWRPTMRLFDSIRLVRNRGDYESIGLATIGEVTELRAEVLRLLPIIIRLLDTPRSASS